VKKEWPQKFWTYTAAGLSDKTVWAAFEIKMVKAKGQRY